MRKVDSPFRIYIPVYNNFLEPYSSEKCRLNWKTPTRVKRIA